MNPKHHGRVFVYCFLNVLKACDICCADLDELTACHLQNFGDTEASAYLNLLAAGNYDFLSACEGL